MADSLLDGLGPVVTRWTMGGGAASVAPADWRKAVGSGPDADLRLLAISGHFLGAMVVGASSAPLRALPDLPVLALPALAGVSRQLARRVLAAIRDNVLRGQLLEFLAARGWSVHPGDWLPGSADEAVPDAYAPWCDWLAACAVADPRPREAAAALTAETWDYFWPAARGVELARLRRRDPAAARELVAVRFAGEGAEARLRLLSLLETGLSAEDRPFLEGLATDRAPKVKAQSAAMLARLGGLGTSGTDAAELAGFFEVQTKGLLRRTRVIVGRPTKTPAQAGRRAALLEAVDFAGFATALGLSPQELAAQWNWGAITGADLGFAHMAERTAALPEIETIAAALDGSHSLDVALLQVIAPRLAAPQRAGVARRIVGVEGGGFRLVLTIAGPEPGLGGLIGTAAGAAVLAALSGPEKPTRPIDLPGELLALGLLASRHAAAATLAAIAATGVASADPRLDMLRLNIMLDQGGNT